jgi:hypothetical protein
MLQNKKQPMSVRLKIRETCRKRVLTDQWKKNVTKAIIRRCAKPVYCFETRERYESVSAAARALGISPVQVSRVCNGLRYTVHGLTFSFWKK